MKGEKWALALAFLLAAKGAGLLPQGREPEERKLVSTLAVDGKETITVTAVTGVRATEDEEPEVIKGMGNSLASACRELRSGSARRIYLGQTEQLLLGEDRNLEETLDFVLSDRELRLDTLLYIVKGNAGEALAASAEKAAGEIGGEDPNSRTIGEVLPRLAEGEYTLVPALTLDGDGMLEPAGWAALGPGGVAGYFTKDAAQGAALLAGLGGDRVVTLPHGTVELTSARTWASDGILHCALTARVVEGEPGKKDLEAWGENILETALIPGWDCWGLERQMNALRPRDWAEWRSYSVEELKVRVTGRLVRP